MIMAGRTIASFGLPADDRRADYYCVKEAVMPWGRFPGADVILGPEMKSTGEVMGIAGNFPAAYIKTQLAIDYSVPDSGAAFISVNDRDKRPLIPIARDIERLGFAIVATSGTCKALRASGIECTEIGKIHEHGESILDAIADGRISLMINTPMGSVTRDDGYDMRAAAVRHGITYVTTLAAAQALVAGMDFMKRGSLDVVALQDLPQWEEEVA